MHQYRHPGDVRGMRRRRPDGRHVLTWWLAGLTFILGLCFSPLWLLGWICYADSTRPGARKWGHWCRSAIYLAVIISLMRGLLDHDICPFLSINTSVEMQV